MKYLILIALFFVVLWLLRKSQFLRKAAPPPAARAPERMVRCAYCGVNQPVSESILSQGHYYCSAEHHQKGEAGGV